MTNQVLVQGYVYKVDFQGFTQSGKESMIFRLKVYQGKDRKPLFISCACYSYTAARAKASVKDGSKVIVTGALSASEDKEGKQRIGIFCTDVNVLESTPSDNPVPFQKNQDYDPSFTEEDAPF